MNSLATSYADLEIRIRKRESQGYPVEMSLFVRGKQEFGPGYLAPDILKWVPSVSHQEDGERFFKWLLADDRLKTAWAEIRGQRPQRHIRLRIDAEAPELHAIPWELLRELSDTGVAYDLAAGTATPFSRYLAGPWLPGRPVAERPLRILAAIASPKNLETEYPSLGRIDVAAEWRALQEATTGLEVAWNLLPEPCTLAALATELQKGYHVLHFLGHGAYNKNEGKALLYLAGADNRVQLTPDDEISEMFGRQLAGRPFDEEGRLRLVFLASCSTATRSPADAFRGLAPKLVAAGVPAVVAMQEPVPVDTARTFAGTFYRRLLEHGILDLASNEARSALLSARLSGAQIPVLFSRLEDNQLLAPTTGDARPVIERKGWEPETVLIPAGKFIMGSDDEAAPAAEKPRHEVWLPACRIGKYPVTNKQYAEFIKALKLSDLGEAHARKPEGWFNLEPPAGRLDHPVTGVSWLDAIAYCHWLREQSGRSYRLPTEAEWEKAARGTDGRRYPWGDAWDPACVNVGKDTTPVTDHPSGASPFGCQDLLGNVLEWTCTMWGTQPKQPDYPYPYHSEDGREVTDPRALPAQARLVCRGGPYPFREESLRCTARGNMTPDTRAAWRGFRAVMDIL